MSTNPAAPRLVGRRRRRPGGNKLTMRRGVPLRDAVLGGFQSHRRLRPLRGPASFRGSDRIRPRLPQVGAPRPGRRVAPAARRSGGPRPPASRSELRRAFGPTGALRDTHILADTLRDFPSDDPAREAILRALEEEAGGESAPAGRCSRRKPDPSASAARSRGDPSPRVRDGRPRPRRRPRLAAHATGAQTRRVDGPRRRFSRVAQARQGAPLPGRAARVDRQRRAQAPGEDPGRRWPQELGRVTDLIVLQIRARVAAGAGDTSGRAVLMEEIRLAHRRAFAGASGARTGSLRRAPAEFARRVLAERG